MTLSEVIKILAGLSSIQQERIAHDKQTKDQTQPAQDILDKKVQKK